MAARCARVAPVGAHPGGRVVLGAASAGARRVRGTATTWDTVMSAGGARRGPAVPGRAGAVAAGLEAVVAGPRRALTSGRVGPAPAGRRVSERGAALVAWVVQGGAGRAPLVVVPVVAVPPGGPVRTLGSGGRAAACREGATPLARRGGAARSGVTGRATAPAGDGALGLPCAGTVSTRRGGRAGSRRAGTRAAALPGSGPVSAAAAPRRARVGSGRAAAVVPTAPRADPTARRAVPTARPGARAG